MSAAGNLNERADAERLMRSRSPLLATERLLAVSSGHFNSCNTLHEWLESLPLMAFLERGEEMAAANDLARSFIGTGDSMKVDRVLLGAYPDANPDAKDARQRFECLVVPPGGDAVTVSGVVQAFPAAGDGARLVLLMEPKEDSADRVAGDRCNDEATFLEELFDMASEAMVIVQEGRILRANREFLRIFGYPIEACLGSIVFDLVVPEGRMHETEMLKHTVETEGRATMETVRRTSSGEALDVSIVVTLVRLGAGRSGNLVTYRDIRQEKQLQAKLQHTALHDPLTGLANRVLFMDRLTLTMARLRRRPDRNFAVIFLDLDRFKPVNDTWGHAAGDTLLLTTAARLRACLRPQDTVARFGGDEFALVLDEAGSTEDIEYLARRIQNELQLPVDIGGGEVCVSASMGIVLGSTAYNDVEDILRDADSAMYRAKEKGRARHEFFVASATSQHGMPSAIRSVSEAA
jgi:diguanylate cyclase (GGDEF)-like protein/PAS domain S-box-containing protein